MSAPRQIAILMACHNRRGGTLRCLASLNEAVGQVEKRAESGRWRVHLYLVDDGSTDGTGEAVREWADKHCQPSTFNLNLIFGTGNLYWAKGMALAWDMACARESIDGRYDGFLWLNDDTVLDATALTLLFEKDNGESLLVGDLTDADGRLVYGLGVNGWVNGNFVYVPCRIFGAVGTICSEYSHAWADSDYAMRVKRAGFAIVSVGTVGRTEWHPLRPKLKGASLGTRLRMLSDPKGWNLHDLYLYRKRNWGRLRAWASCVHMFLHVVAGRD